MLDDRYQPVFRYETATEFVEASPETGRLLVNVFALTSLIVEFTGKVALSEEAGKRLIAYAIEELNRSPDPAATYRFWLGHLDGFSEMLRKAASERAGTAGPQFHPAVVGVEDLAVGFARCCGPAPDL